MDHPDWSTEDIAKHCAQQWLEVSDEEKPRYEAQAVADQGRYAEQMAVFNANIASDLPELELPTPFDLFLEERRAQPSVADSAAEVEALAQEWSALSLVERAQYEAKVETVRQQLEDQWKQTRGKRVRADSNAARKSKKIRREELCSFCGNYGGDVRPFFCVLFLFLSLSQYTLSFSSYIHTSCVQF